jgi:hypothetical protein
MTPIHLSFKKESFIAESTLVFARTKVSIGRIHYEYAMEYQGTFYYLLSHIHRKGFCTIISISHTEGWSWFPTNTSSCVCSSVIHFKHQIWTTNCKTFAKASITLHRQLNARLYKLKDTGVNTAECHRYLATVCL